MMYDGIAKRSVQILWTKLEEDLAEENKYKIIQKYFDALDQPFSKNIIGEHLIR